MFLPILPLPLLLVACRHLHYLIAPLLYFFVTSNSLYCSHYILQQALRGVYNYQCLRHSMKAPIWRFLMSIGMYFHHFPRPHPPSASFTIKIPSRLSKISGTIKLIFYVPHSYQKIDNLDYRFPVIINYHGGGFTLGKGTDDARWARAAVEKTDAVFVSVEYRLAPRHPFSVGIEDCADAVIYLAAHADELRLDPNRIALSGFSAGANFALTVPLLIKDLQMSRGIRTLRDIDTKTLKRTLSDAPRQSGTSTPGNENHEEISVSKPGGKIHLSHDTRKASSSSLNLPLKGLRLQETDLEVTLRLPDLSIKSIVAFYPPTDFRISRADKKRTNPKPEYNLPPVLTNLFDDSYLPSDQKTTCDLDFSDPYLSPAAATTEQLHAAYPRSVILYTCEYDMLNAEGVAFGERLTDEVGIDVKGGLIRGVPHAFDKKPNPIRFPKDADRCYAEACAHLNEALGRRESFESRRVLDQQHLVERFEESGKINRVELGDTQSIKAAKMKEVKESRRRSSTMPLPAQPST